MNFSIVILYRDSSLPSVYQNDILSLISISNRYYPISRIAIVYLQGIWYIRNWDDLKHILSRIMNYHNDWERSML
jgi:hypothetical protein